MKKKTPKGVTVFGLLLLVSSLIHMATLAFNYGWYRENMLTCMPEWLVVIRYCFSWFLRILGLAVGTGILNFSNACRKLGIALGIFTVATLYWKHPYSAFLRHTHYLDEQFSYIFQGTGVTFVSLTLVSLIAHYLLDILFWWIFIYYFTRPEIKDRFN